ncbi:helix-turn-helix transcriptional regulator [Paraliobacillus sediminis]|uniref:helix-turn-helix transcriptional regulator n=1 Tax=Paraliobacillus sediminis TaxID=1885916 RepID=UPI0013C2A619|nr:WYL domain-containing protein [Paraliobacillus sediminis]
MSKVSNCLSMIELLLARKKMKLEELAEELEVKPRMIRTYKDELEKAGIYVESERGANGGYSLNKQTFLPIRNFDENEIQQLQIAIKSFLSRKPDESATLQHAFEKIKAAQRDLDLNSRHFYFANDYLINNEVGNASAHYKLLYEAFNKSKSVEISYIAASTNETTRRIIHPYAFVVYDENLYCTAFCEAKQAMRNFKIMRIQEVSILDQAYVLPKDYDIRQEFPNLGFIKDPIQVELIIHPPLANRIKESIYSDDQVIEVLDNYDIRFKATLNGQQSIKKWILGMGMSAEVIQPQALRSEIKQDIVNLVEIYNK